MVRTVVDQATIQELKTNVDGKSRYPSWITDVPAILAASKNYLVQQYLLIFDSRVELQHECSILQAKVKGSQDLGKRREELALKEEHNNLLNSIIRELGYEGELRYKLTQSEVSKMVAARFAQIKEEHDNLTRLETLFSALFVRAELDHSLVKAAQIRNRRHESIALKEKRHEVLKLISSLASGGNWTPAILSSDPTVRDQHHLPHSIKDVVDKYKDSQKFAPRMSSYLMTPMCSTLAGV